MSEEIKTEYRHAQWFRSWHGAPTDPKWIMIAARANTNAGIVSALYWALLDHASQAEPRGSVASFDVETYAAFSGFSAELIQSVMRAMQDKGIVDDGQLSSWNKRQPKREDSSRERTRHWRERQRAEPVTHGDASVTHSDAREEKNREEKNGEENLLPNGFDEFWQVYPRKSGKLPAMEAFRDATKTTPPEKIITAAKQQAGQLRWQEEPKYIPNPERWLREGRWDDAPEPEPRPRSPII